MIDLRSVNAATKPTQWPMIQTEGKLTDFIGCKHFTLLDFCFCIRNARWDHHHIHGLKKASAYFPSTAPPLLDTMKHAIKARLNDFIVYTTTEAKLLQRMHKFLSICENDNLQISATKSVSYTKKVKWCGRISDGKKYQRDPQKIEALRNIEVSIAVSELCQLTHCCRWMSKCILDFRNIVGPLDELLEKAYAKAGKQKEKALEIIALHTYF